MFSSSVSHVFQIFLPTSDPNLKQSESARMEAKIDETKQKIVEQEAQIAELKAESIDLQKREKQGIANITQVSQFQRHFLLTRFNPS